MDVDEITIAKRDGTYIAVVGNRAFKINEHFYELFILMKDGCGIDEAARIVAKRSDILVNDVLDSYNSFVEHVNKYTKRRSSYIKGHLTLLSEKYVRMLSLCFHHLFDKKLFLPLFFVSGIVNIYYYYSVIQNIDKSSFNWSIWQILILVLLCQISTLFHEIGHSSASFHFGQNAERIGFGFYLVFPVFYTDVTKVWLLPQKKRIVVNAGGIYFQMLINMFLFFTYLVVDNEFICNGLLYISISNSIVIMTSFLPFFRNDGYWVLSDYFNTENLLSVSDKWLVSKMLFYKAKKVHVKPIVKLFALANWSFRIYILSKLCMTTYDMLYKIKCSDSSMWTTLSNVCALVFCVLGVYFMTKMMISKIIKYDNVL